MTDSRPLLVAFTCALVIAAAATPLVRAWARRIGAVAAPKQDRWHKTPVAMLGGVAIFVATIGALLLAGGQSAQRWAVIAAAGALFVLGLVDDFLHLQPLSKLIGQLLAASAVISFGLTLPWSSWPVVNIALTLLWLVGVTNAVNMLDNMDGLCAGVAAISCIALAAQLFLSGDSTGALMPAALCGALAGFLLFNHRPASIFMGDCGSLFVGFVLACTALLAAGGGAEHSRDVIAAVAVPVLAVSIPIFDGTFVTVMRRMAGRPVSRGGRDHTSHRLVTAGLSERHAVWMLYALGALGGTLAIAVRHTALDVSIAATAGFACVLVALAVRLGRVPVWGEEE